MMSMVRSEFRKVTTTKVLLWLTIATIAFSALNVVLLVFLTPRAMDIDPELNLLLDPAYVTNILGAAGSSSIFILILGIIGMTSEYRHMTITSTFLATPKRPRVLIAKGITYALLGAALGLIAFITSFAVTLIALMSDEHAPVDIVTALQILGGVVLAFAIYAFVGVSVGALIRNQVAAIVGALVWVLIVEALLTVFVDWIGKWLPGGALDAVLQTTNVTGRGGEDILPTAIGVVVLLGYAVLFGLLASLTTLRRDIT
jgi:ABC-type transport system involved in multi-copper enzyme maturation permease subunit